MSPVDTCALCPRLCRHACPVATSSAREAAVPTLIADVLLAWSRGQLGDDDARAAVALCVDCGACQDACHLHQPLPAAIRAARLQLLPPGAMAPVRLSDLPAGATVVIEADERPWATAFGRRTGAVTVALRTTDGLGAAHIGTAAWEIRAGWLRSALADHPVVHADGDVARALTAAGVPHTWLHEALDLPLTPSCAGDQVQPGCCGGADPLRTWHPSTAARMASRWPAAVADGRCRRWLDACGRTPTDAVDALLEEAP